MIPHFVGVEENKFVADYKHIEKCINKKTVAIMIPNLLGNIANWKKISQIAKKYKLKVIEDSADTIGYSVDKKNTGKYNFINFIKEYNLLLDNQFSQLLKIDKNLNPILSSLKKRHHNDFDNLNKKIIKSLKTMDETSINQIRKLHYKIFPNGVQQERYINFSHFYSIMGTELIDKLFSVIDPFEPKYKVCIL